MTFLFIAIWLISVKCIHAECIIFENDQPSLPQALSRHQSVYSVNLNSVFIFGGSNQNLNINNRNIYKWNRTRTNPSFEPISIADQDIVSRVNAAVLINDIVWIMGYRPDDYFKILRYNLLTQEFLSDPVPLPVKKGTEPCVATNQSHIFMIGGRSTKNGFDLIAYTQIYNIDDELWTSHDIISNDTNHTQIEDGWSEQLCVIVNDYLYAFGGCVTDDPDNSCETVLHDMYKYNINTSDSEWEYLGDMVETEGHGRRDSRAIAYQHYIYILAGYNIKSVEIFDTKMDALVCIRTLSICVYDICTIIQPLTLWL